MGPRGHSFTEWTTRNTVIQPEGVLRGSGSNAGACSPFQHSCLSVPVLLLGPTVSSFSYAIVIAASTEMLVADWWSCARLCTSHVHCCSVHSDGAGKVSTSSCNSVSIQQAPSE